MVEAGFFLLFLFSLTFVTWQELIVEHTKNVVQISASFKAPVKLSLTVHNFSERGHSLGSDCVKHKAV